MPTCDRSTRSWASNREARRPDSRLNTPWRKPQTTGDREPAWPQAAFFGLRARAGLGAAAGRSARLAGPAVAFLVSICSSPALNFLSPAWSPLICWRRALAPPVRAFARTRPSVASAFRRAASTRSAGFDRLTFVERGRHPLLAPVSYETAVKAEGDGVGRRWPPDPLSRPPAGRRYRARSRCRRDPRCRDCG